jgi:DNA replication protein DnaC
VACPELAGCFDCGAPLDTDRRAWRVCASCADRRRAESFWSTIPDTLERHARIVGAEYAQHTLADFPTALQTRGIEAFRRFVTRDPVLYGLILKGDYGPGKTTFAAAAVRLWICAGASVRWLQARDFFRQIRDTYDEHGGAEGDVVDPVKAADLVVLDDLGREGEATPHVLSVLHEVLDDRMRDRRPTIITTNLAGDLGSRYGEAIGSRLARYDTIVIEGPDRRRRR